MREITAGPSSHKKFSVAVLVRTIRDLNWWFTPLPGCSFCVELRRSALAFSVLEHGCECIQLSVQSPHLGAFLFGWHWDIGDVYIHSRGRLTRQRQDLVHSDPSPDSGIAQLGLT